MGYDYDRRATILDGVPLFRVKKLKIEGVEFVRADTYKVEVNLGKEGRLRVVVYPGNSMQVFGEDKNGPMQLFQRDLSDDQQKQIVKAVEAFKAKHEAKTARI